MECSQPLLSNEHNHAGLESRSVEASGGLLSRVKLSEGSGGLLSHVKLSDRLSGLGSILAVAFTLLTIIALCMKIPECRALLALGPASGESFQRVELSDQALTGQIALTPEQKNSYARDGVILMRSLLTPSQAKELRTDAATAARTTSSFMDLLPKAPYAKILFDLWRTRSLFARVTVQQLPSLAAQLLPHPRLRLLRDALFSYEPGRKGCGWHVDDEGFWPTKNDTGGLTVWIALDEMKVSEGGGLAVAQGTHIDQPWIRACRQAIKGDTCAMESRSPECHQKMEWHKLQWDMQPGDAIVWDRWIFHRSVPFHGDVNKIKSEEGALMRYTVRYIPDNATAIGLLHASVQQGGSFIGSPYYPQVWPDLIPEERAALENGFVAQADMAAANPGKGVANSVKDKVKRTLGVQGGEEGSVIS
eukprot:gb/GEZN01006130.1/.p1 GENE.gb/GEZN01006130.1/~~gb/GEZN01006130.1/.p1  ORF type:complete len:419 (-),score=42.93 gb/GEZN01006130.1/:199-1455(-)